ncbi:hypothetical protein WN51_14400 [Melipona quadrifasciata]|uniref:Uncharacterized protein n=1 Tax=Melipona quadrifasciata TaxID=166423 RepID=A0A0N0BFI0_9HYME|nr:hypothetical protein WN51_14400 [Melipona quadrifasciata]
MKLDLAAVHNDVLIGIITHANSITQVGLNFDEFYKFEKSCSRWGVEIFFSSESSCFISSLEKIQGCRNDPRREVMAMLESQVSSLESPMATTLPVHDVSSRYPLSLRHPVYIPVHLTSFLVHAVFKLEYLSRSFDLDPVFFACALKSQICSLVIGEILQIVSYEISTLARLSSALQHSRNAKLPCSFKRIYSSEGSSSPPGSVKSSRIKLFDEINGVEYFLQLSKTGVQFKICKSEDSRLMYLANVDHDSEAVRNNSILFLSSLKLGFRRFEACSYFELTIKSYSNPAHNPSLSPSVSGILQRMCLIQTAGAVGTNYTIFIKRTYIMNLSNN